MSVSAIISFGAVDRISACPRIGVSSLRGDGSEELVTSSLLFYFIFCLCFWFSFCCVSGAIVYYLFSFRREPRSS